MDNIKTKLQTQTIRPSCEKLENFENIKNEISEKSKEIHFFYYVNL